MLFIILMNCWIVVSSSEHWMWTWSLASMLFQTKINWLKTSVRLAFLAFLIIIWTYLIDSQWSLAFFTVYFLLIRCDNVNDCNSLNLFMRALYQSSMSVCWRSALDTSLSSVIYHIAAASHSAELMCRLTTASLWEVTWFFIYSTNKWTSLIHIFFLKLTMSLKSKSSGRKESKYSKSSMWKCVQSCWRWAVADEISSAAIDSNQLSSCWNWFMLRTDASMMNWGGNSTVSSLVYSWLASWVKDSPDVKDLSCCLFFCFD